MPEVTSYAPGAPCWVDLLTSDPQGARAFYGPLLGWEFQVGGPEHGGYITCTLDDRTVAGIAGDPAPQGMPTAWTTYLASPDAAAMAGQVTEHGGKLMMGPLDIPGMGVMAVALDPQGAAFGVWQGGGLVGSQVLDQPGSVTWNELATTDLAAARAFYSAVAGYAWEPVDTGDGGPAYATFQVGDRAVGGALEMDEAWGDASPHWVTYFAVADTDAAVASVERLGGQVVTAPTDTSFGRQSLVADPQGGMFSVIESASS